MLDFLSVLALVADDSFDTFLCQDIPDAIFLPGCCPGGVFMQKIPTGVDLVLVSYICITKRRCTIARMYSRRTMVGSLNWLLKACHVQNALQAGLPTTRIGF